MHIIMLYAIGLSNLDIWRYFPICLKTVNVVLVKTGALKLCLLRFSFCDCLQNQKHNSKPHTDNQLTSAHFHLLIHPQNLVSVLLILLHCPRKNIPKPRHPYLLKYLLPRMCRLTWSRREYHVQHSESNNSLLE